MRGILFIFVCLLSFPTQAVTIPGVTTPTSTNAQTAPAKEPDIEQKKAAYGALADVLENDASRQELIGQLRKVATAPPAEPVPTIVPPTLTEEKRYWKTSRTSPATTVRHSPAALPSFIAILPMPRIRPLIRKRSPML